MERSLQEIAVDAGEEMMILKYAKGKGRNKGLKNFQSLVDFLEKNPTDLDLMAILYQAASAPCAYEEIMKGVPAEDFPDFFKNNILTTMKGIADKTIMDRPLIEEMQRYCAAIYAAISRDDSIRQDAINRLVREHEEAHEEIRRRWIVSVPE